MKKLFIAFIICLSLAVVALCISLFNYKNNLLAPEQTVPIIDMPDKVYQNIPPADKTGDNIPASDKTTTDQPPPSQSDLPQWQRNALPFTPQPGQPLLAIVIDDIGLSHYSRDIIKLPGPLTLSFMPYAENLPGQVAAAQQARHEILLHMPMQPLGRHNPGPNALTTDLSADDIKQRTAAALDKIPGVIGLNNHMGSAFTQDAAGMAAVMAVLHDRGLVFLDSKTIGNSVGPQTAQAAQVPALARDIFLDNDENAAAITQQLAAAAALAECRGLAIAIGHPYPATIAALKNWLTAPHAVQLVPLSALYMAKLPQP